MGSCQKRNSFGSRLGKIILAPKAKADIRHAYDWYEEQSPGLGDEFLICVEEAFLVTANYPTRFPVRFDNARRILVRRFPYAVYYDYDDTSVYIYYVFHCAQNPMRLYRRLRDI